MTWNSTLLPPKTPLRGFKRSLAPSIPPTLMHSQPLRDYNSPVSEALSTFIPFPTTHSTIDSSSFIIKSSSLRDPKQQEDSSMKTRCDLSPDNNVPCPFTLIILLRSYALIFHCISRFHLHFCIQYSFAYLILIETSWLSVILHHISHSFHSFVIFWEWERDGLNSSSTKTVESKIRINVFT